MLSHQHTVLTVTIGTDTSPTTQQSFMNSGRPHRLLLIYEVWIVQFLLYFPLQVLLQLCWWSFNLHSLFTCLDMREQDTLNWNKAVLRVCTLVVLSRCIALSFPTSMLKALNFSLHTHGSFCWIFIMVSWLCSNEGWVRSRRALWVVFVALSPRSAFTFCFCNRTSIHSTGDYVHALHRLLLFSSCVSFLGAELLISLPSCVANSISCAAVRGEALGDDAPCPSAFCTNYLFWAQ